MRHASDIIAAVFLLYGFIRGCGRGLLAALTAAASLILGYAAALMCGRAVGELLIARGWLKGVIAYPVGSLLAFMGVGLILRLAVWLLRRVLERWTGKDLHGSLKLAGGLVGAVHAGFYALLICHRR